LDVVRNEEREIPFSGSGISQIKKGLPLQYQAFCGYGMAILFHISQTWHPMPESNENSVRWL
jgi:hypothetical protein